MRMLLFIVTIEYSEEVCVKNMTEFLLLSLSDSTSSAGKIFRSGSHDRTWEGSFVLP